MPTAVGDFVAVNRVMAGIVTQVHAAVPCVVKLAILDRQMGRVLDLNKTFPVVFPGAVATIFRSRAAVPSVTECIGEFRAPDGKPFQAHVFHWIAFP